MVLYQLSYDPSLLKTERQFRCRSRKVNCFGPLRRACAELGGFRNHAALAGEIEEAARIDDGFNVTERFQLIDFAGLVNFHRGRIKIDRHGIAGLQNVAKALGGFAGIKFTGCDAVPEENAGETFGDDDAGIGGAHRNGGMFAGTATAEILPGDDYGIFSIRLPFLDEPLRVKIVRQAAESVAAELFVFLLDGRNEVQILGRNDLVGVDVIFHDVNRTCKH